MTNCVSNPCRNNDTCSYVDNNYTCQCAPGFTGSYCETKHALVIDDNLCRNVIIVVVITIVILIILIIVITCVKKHISTRKSKDAEISRRYDSYETRNSTSEPVRYSGINSSDKNCNIGKSGNQPSGNAIYGHVVQSSNDDHKEDVTTSSSMVYADLEFVQQEKKGQTPSGQGCTTQPPSSCTGLMGDICAMVGK